MEIELNVSVSTTPFSRIFQQNHKSKLADYARYYAQMDEKQQQEEEAANEASDGGFHSSNTPKKRLREDEDGGAAQAEAPHTGDQGKNGITVYGT